MKDHDISYVKFTLFISPLIAFYIAFKSANNLSELILFGICYYFGALIVCILIGAVTEFVWDKIESVLSKKIKDERTRSAIECFVIIPLITCLIAAVVVFW